VCSGHSAVPGHLHARSIPHKPSERDPLMAGFGDRFKEIRYSVHLIERASFAKQAFVGIQPFVDCNVRTASLIINMILINKGYRLASIHPDRRKAYIGNKY
jgi:Fic family protein